MRLFTATIIANTALQIDGNVAHLIELHVPQLVQAIQPGQYCLVRCCHPLALDPLLRRPFFIHSIQRAQGRCTLLVYVHGRGSAWLASQAVGAELDLLGPHGHGWTFNATVRNLLLISNMQLMVALPFFIQVAIEQELAVTLLCQSASQESAYPPALLAPEVEYHILTPAKEPQNELINALETYLPWADAAYCCVSRETLTVIYNHFERLRGKHFAQGIVLQPLVCGSGACFTCSIETHSGTKLVCRDGPVFALREIVRG
jgi:dihydroorotate dehydrogenase electron transfer subunit